MVPQHRFTAHAKKRYIDRIHIPYPQSSPISQMASDFYKSSVCNLAFNDTAFMTSIYDKYGYGAVVFRVTDNVVYVCRDNAVITVFPKAHTRYSVNTSARYRKK